MQQAARVLVARRRASRRREAIAALQAFYRGCRARWVLCAALEEAQTLRLDARRGGGGGGGDAAGEGERGRATAVRLSLHGREGASPRSGLPQAYDGFLQVGKVTRRNVPMDADCPEGFGKPNLAAFLWESREEAYGPCFGAEDADSSAAPRAPHSGEEDRRSCWREEGGDVSNDESDGAVFELSTKALNLTTSFRQNGVNRNSSRAEQASHADDEREGTPPDSNEPLAPPVAPAQQPPQRPRWTPVAVAPQQALEQALRCSTLVVSSPSFDSACSRRLFSRIGRPPPPLPPRPSPLRRGQPTADPQRITPRTVSPRMTECPQQHPHTRAGFGVKSEDREGLGSTLASEEEVGRDQTAWRNLQGVGLRHIMLVGESPIGDGGLSELSSAVRCRRLPRLTTLVIGGPGCRVGPRGVTALAVALSSAGCSQLRNLVSKQKRMVVRQRRCFPEPQETPPARLPARPPALVKRQRYGSEMAFGGSCFARSTSTFCLMPGFSVVGRLLLCDVSSRVLFFSHSP